MSLSSEESECEASPKDRDTADHVAHTNSTAAERTTLAKLGTFGSSKALHSRSLDDWNAAEHGVAIALITTWTNDNVPTRHGACSLLGDTDRVRSGDVVLFEDRYGYVLSSMQPEQLVSDFVRVLRAAAVTKTHGEAEVWRPLPRGEKRGA